MRLKGTRVNPNNPRGNIHLVAGPRLSLVRFHIRKELYCLRETRDKTISSLHCFGVCEGWMEEGEGCLRMEE